MSESSSQKDTMTIVQAIEFATQSLLAQPDQNAFLEICAQINQSKTGPRVALDDMVSRLEQTAEDDPKAACFTLMLLDLCVKNCGYRFTRKLCKDEYVKRLKKIVKRKDTTIGVQKRLLGLIQVWALALSEHVDFQSLNQLYQDLLDNSVEFPTVDAEAVELLRLTFQSPQLYKMSELTSRTSAEDVEAKRVVQDLYNDLRLTTLGLPAVEAAFQDPLSCPPDPATVRQLQTTTDHLVDLQRRLLAHMRLQPGSTSLAAATNLNPEATFRESPNQAKSTACDRSQSHNTCERIHLRKTEGKGEKKRSGAETTNAAEETPSSSFLSTLAANSANTTAANNLASSQPEGWRQTVELTLSQASEDLKRFHTRLLAVADNPSLMADAVQMAELRSAVQRMQLFRQKLVFVIEDCSTIFGDFSHTVNKEDEEILASLMQTNEEVLKSLAQYESLIQDLQRPDNESQWTAAGHAKTAGGSSQSSLSAVANVATFSNSTSSIVNIMEVLEAHLKPFNVLLTNMVDGPVDQTVMANQIDELQFVIRHLEAFRRYLAVMIKDWSATLNLYLTSEENERTIAGMTRMNDMICKLRDKYLRAYDEMGFGETTMLATRQIATADTAGFQPAQSGPVTVPSRGTTASFTSPSRPTPYPPRGTVAGIRVAPSRRHLLSFIAQLLDVVEDLLERSQVLLKETEDDSLHPDQILEGGCVIQSLILVREILLFTIEDSSSVLSQKDGSTLANMIRANDMIFYIVGAYRRRLFGKWRVYKEPGDDKTAVLYVPRQPSRQESSSDYRSEALASGHRSCEHYVYVEPYRNSSARHSIHRHGSRHR